MKKTTALLLYSCLLLALTGGHAFAQGWPVDINSTSTNGLRVSLAGAMGIELTTDPTTGRPRILSYNRQSNVYGDLLIEHAPNAQGVLFKSNGNVGIGTLNPQYKLHVNGSAYFSGDIHADGTIHAKFQDIAEWVPAVESLEPGMVVVVAPRNHVAASTEAYDTRVAGVISPRPGLTLGEAGQSKVLVATTGRVKVRVDASNGRIREGDILVSSPIKGTAMKSEPLVLNGRRFHQPGTVIGKALESLEQGTGEILVLLSMQ